MAMVLIQHVFSYVLEACTGVWNLSHMYDKYVHSYTNFVTIAEIRFHLHPDHRDHLKLYKNYAK